jgi:hypothetical protein
LSKLNLFHTESGTYLTENPKGLLPLTKCPFLKELHVGDNNLGENERQLLQGHLDRRAEVNF